MLDEEFSDLSFSTSCDLMHTLSLYNHSHMHIHTLMHVHTYIHFPMLNHSHAHTFTHTLP